MNQMAASDVSERKRRPKVLVSLQIYLALLLAAIVLVMLGMWWLGLGLENGKALTAAFLTLLFFGTLGEFVRQRFRVSLKGLLAAFTVLAILLGLLAQPLIEARKRAHVVARLQRLGASVGYDYQYDEVESDWLTVQEGFIVPTWLRDVLGDETFADVWRIAFTGSQCRDADLEEIDRLQSVKDLQVNESRITERGIVVLAKLPKLEAIMIDGDQATEAALKELGEATQLESLCLYGPQVTDATLAHLKHLPKLRRLSLWDTTVTDQGLQNLSGLRDLEYLNLHSRQITSVGIAHLKSLTHLRSLHFERTAITDTGIVQLKEMRGLQSISFFGGSVSDDAVDKLRAAMPQAEITN